MRNRRAGGVAGPENLGIDRSTRYGFERDGPNELASAAGHYYVYLGAGLCKQTRQPH